jgi:hypothetical protein
MAAGCAGRHPEIPIKYIVDGEGPSNSFVTAHEPWVLYTPPSHPSHNRYEQVHQLFGHYSIYRDPSPENEAFWTEREADKFIGEFRGRYLRLQAEWDHAQPPSSPAEIPMFDQTPLWWQCKHATDMVNAAVAGGVPWVRVNLADQGNLINATYDVDNQPVYLPGQLADKPCRSCCSRDGQNGLALRWLGFVRTKGMSSSHTWNAIQQLIIWYQTQKHSLFSS